MLQIGGYWLSCMGDEIFADKSSIVGSIGVISASFGFTEAINKLGVERRVYTTGKSKGSLDPFKPEKKEDVQMLKNIMNDTQKAFVDLVSKKEISYQMIKPFLQGLFGQVKRQRN